MTLPGLSWTLSEVLIVSYDSDRMICICILHFHFDDIRWVGQRDQLIILRNENPNVRIRQPEQLGNHTLLGTELDALSTSFDLDMG